MAGQARASYPEKMQKNDQNPPAKNPSCHVKVQLVCGDGPLYIITFSKKNGILGNADFPPNKHTPTRRHADTPTRRHADRGHAAHTQPTHQHTHREGGWKVATVHIISPSSCAHSGSSQHSETPQPRIVHTQQAAQCQRSGMDQPYPFHIDASHRHLPLCNLCVSD